MPRKLARRTWCILVKHLSPCNTIQRWLVRRKLAALRKWREEVEKEKAAAQFHSRLMAYPIYRSRYQAINFLRNTPRMWSFIDLAVAHYNTQIDRGSGGYYIKPDLESKLDIAENYFIRDRAGLVEWWCKFTKDGREFLGEEGTIKQDLGIPFHDVLADICLRKHGIKLQPDPIEQRSVIRWPCLDINGNPNTSLMNEVQAKAAVY